MLLIELPRDILDALPSYLHSFQDLSSVLLTCRTLYIACSSLTPVQLGRLTKASKPGLHPQPHLFIAIKARKLADWAVDKAHPKRRADLGDAIKAGPAMLLKLALEVDPLSLSDHLRASWVKRMVLDPITEEMNTECGVGPSACEDVGLAILNFWIYCDLSHHTIVPPLLFSPDDLHTIEPLSTALRLDWLHYCVPDNNDKFVEPEGEFQQLDLFRLLGAFRPRFRQALIRNGGEFEIGPNKRTWFHVITSHMGLASLRLLVPRENSERFPRDIRQIKIMMENLDAPQRKTDLYSLTGAGEDQVDQKEVSGEGEDEDGEEGWVSLPQDIMICLEWT